MATGIYLVDNPPAIRQYRSPRRERPSGVVVVHTAESFPDESPPDTGAENVAAFIRRRTNYGSYHDLVDSDSTIQLVRYSDEAFHDATGSNPHSYGVSAATQAAKWSQLGDGWVERTVWRMAAASARYARWLFEQRGIVLPARRITRAQSEDRVPGFISHAERDPARRSDPGASFPWRYFLDNYAAIMAGAITQPEEDVQLTDTVNLFPSDGNVKYANTRTTVGGILASTNYYTLYARNVALKNAAKLDVIVAAVQAIEGVDAEALAAALNRIDVEDLADAVADELAERIAADPST